MQTRRDTRQRFGRSSGPPPRLCEHPECGLSGDYPAPKSRTQLRDYRWLCLDHVRAYNKSWNYYAGMSREEIEDDLRADVTWRRPTWRMGATAWHRLRPTDPFDGPPGERAAPGDADAPRSVALTPAQARAFDTLDLTPPVTLEELKTRYRQLVKRYHPDANGGDRTAEERFKAVSAAYAALRDGFSA